MGQRGYNLTSILSYRVKQGHVAISANDNMLNIVYVLNFFMRRREADRDTFDNLVISLSIELIFSIINNK